MKKIVTLLGMLLILTSAVSSQDLTFDDILMNYYKAGCFDKLQKVRTIIMTGTRIQNDVMPLKIIRLRPDKFLQEFDVVDMTSYLGYDGTTPWWTVPWTGNPKPQIMPEDRARDLRVRADFDGVLFNWKVKGFIVEPAGNDTVDKALAYKFKVSFKDGSIEYYSIDVKSFMLVKRQFTRLVNGKEVKLDVYYRDYKDVEGIPFAFTLDNYFGGQPYAVLQFDSIFLNRPVDEKVFKMPSH